MASIYPHEFVERARIDAARMLLEGNDRPLKSVAYDCGFGTADRMRVVFSERLGATPRPLSRKLSKIRTTRQRLN
jgi:transcriptional regulator GlxA family with amidase domain